VKKPNPFYIISLFTVFSMLLLTACGGSSGGSNNNNLTGVFSDGPVEGLRYETASQSGFTNASGEFIYRSGETVTFSIGGIVLGSAPAAAELNPFDLFGLTPPATEAALRSELVNYNDVSDFDRVANIAMLLVSLDNDSNPDNGLDLTGWDTTLAAANLNFDANLYVFYYDAFEQFAATYGVNKGVAITTPLVHLYGSLGITVPANVITEITTDQGNDSSIDTINTRTYTLTGRLSGSTSDADADGNNESVGTYGYDSAGRRTTENFQYDVNDDTLVDRTQNNTFTYDAAGNRLTRLRETDNDANGVIDNRQTNIYTYDANGNRLTRLGVIDNRQTYIYTYDANGNQLTRLSETDNDANGTTDNREIKC